LELKKWKCLKSEEGPDLRLFKARIDLMENPRNGILAPRVVLNSRDAVNVVAVVDETQMVFVKQFRFGTQNFTLEIPGGLIDEGEDPKVAGIRELREETGYKAGDMLPLGKIASNPVYMDAYVFHYQTTCVALHRSETEFDEGEDMLYSGKFDHPHTISALMYYFHGVH
jgi:8-oxo-dGTP pyrophosphatase MutT (NUDIX family)